MTGNAIIIVVSVCKTQLQTHKFTKATGHNHTYDIISSCMLKTDHQQYSARLPRLIKLQNKYTGKEFYATCTPPDKNTSKHMFGPQIFDSNSWKYEQRQLCEILVQWRHSVR